MSAEPPAAKGRLATVMLVDLVGYAALQAWNETEARRRAAALGEILASEVPAAGGKLAERSEEGALAEFAATGAALACAERVLQRVASRNAGRGVADRFEVTIAIALGELVTEVGALSGLPVRAAAAANTLADPGGIALTDQVYFQLRSQTSLRGTFLRRRKFPNLPDPLGVFLIPPAKASYGRWLLRKRRGRVFLAAAVPAALAAWLAGRAFLRPAAPGAAPAPVPSPGRVLTPVLAFKNRDYLSKYDGGGNGMDFSIEPAADGAGQIKIVVTGERGWWGLVVSKAFDLTGADAFAVTARSETGSGFRVMLVDDNDSWLAAFHPTPSTAVLEAPFASFTSNASPEKPGDGRLSLDRVTQIQIMHLDPARSDTLWIGSLAVSGPAFSSTPAR